MNKIETAIKEYQCPGCTLAPFECYQPKDGSNVACSKHFIGTFMSIGKILLGMPKGFNRVGPAENNFDFSIYDTFQDEFNKFNIPVWKHLNKSGHTLVRGMRPRLNQTFTVIFLENCLDQVDCLEISEEEIKAMD